MTAVHGYAANGSYGVPQAQGVSPAASNDDPTSPNYNAEVAAEQQSLSGGASRGPAVTYGGQLALVGGASSLDDQNGTGSSPQGGLIPGATTASSTTSGYTASGAASPSSATQSNSALSAQNNAALTSAAPSAPGGLTGATPSDQSTNPAADQNQPQNPNSQVGQVLLVQSYLPGSFVNVSA